MPLASRTNELAPSAPTSHRALTVRVSPVRCEPARLLLDAPPQRQLRRPLRVDEPLGHPSTLDAHAALGARVAVDRPLQLGLEEHVVRLPPRRRQALDVEAQQQLAVGAEPLVVVHRDHLLRERLGQVERLQQPHDLVIEMHRAGQAVDLAEALEDPTR